MFAALVLAFGAGEPRLWPAFRAPGRCARRGDCDVDRGLDDLARPNCLTSGSWTYTKNPSDLSVEKPAETLCLQTAI
jgi:hypothetical protein